MRCVPRVDLLLKNLVTDVYRSIRDPAYPLIRIAGYSTPEPSVGSSKLPLNATLDIGLGYLSIPPRQAVTDASSFHISALE
jgi:hypothetical protein